MRNVPWFGLEQKQQVAIFLCLFVIWEKPFLEFKAVCEMVCDFVLLRVSSVSSTYTRKTMETHLLQRHAILDEECYPRVEISHILFQNEILLGLGRNLCL